MRVHWRQHVPIALGVGVALAFGHEVIENVRVPDMVFAAVRAQFSEQEIVESIMTIGFYMMMARLTEATETDLDPAAGMKLFDSGKRRSS